MSTAGCGVFPVVLDVTTQNTTGNTKLPQPAVRTLPQESSDITTQVAVVLNIPVVFCVVTSSTTGNTPQPAVDITTGV